MQCLDARTHTYTHQLTDCLPTAHAPSFTDPTNPTITASSAMSSSSSSSPPATPTSLLAAQVAAAVEAASQAAGLSEEGKAKLIEEVTRVVQEEQGQGAAAAAVAVLPPPDAVEAGAPAATAASAKEEEGEGEEEEPPFKLPGELPPGCEQEEAEEVMRLLFEHLKTEDGRCVASPCPGLRCRCCRVGGGGLFVCTRA